jgi:hypothetical protein
MQLRKLGVELMEGRMMLSASGFDVPSPGLNVTQTIFAPAEISSTRSYTVQVTQPTDGGYVNSDSLPVRANWGGQAANDVAYTLSGAGVSGKDINVRPAFQADSSLFSGSGPQVAVIVPWGDGALPVTNNIQPVVVAPNPSAPTVSEGGSIPIHAIFADFRKDSHLASGVKAISSTVAETSVDTLASARREPAADNAIAGEWARAMVFEIAGGEPTASDSHTSDESLQHSGPLSSVKTSQQSEKLAGRHAVGLPNEGSTAGEQGQSQAAQSNGHNAKVVTRIMDAGKLAAGSSAPVSVDQFSADNPLDAESPDAKALAAAFDQLGERRAAVIESTADGKSWVRLIGPSPLLMVLALERIAALNSRRVTWESRIAVAKKPPRLRN